MPPGSSPRRGPPTARERSCKQQPRGVPVAGGGHRIWAPAFGGPARSTWRSNDDRWEELRRQASGAPRERHRGRGCSTPHERSSSSRCSTPTGLVGGSLYPQDGRGNATDTTMSLARGARDGGAQIFEQTPVTDVERRGDRVTGVRTDNGDIEAEYVVNCDRHVGPGVRGAGRGARAAAGAGALLRRHRGDPGPAAGPADHQELGRLVVRQGRGRRPDGRLLRAGELCVGVAWHPADAGFIGCRRTGTTSARSTSG